MLLQAIGDKLLRCDQTHRTDVGRLMFQFPVHHLIFVGHCQRDQIRTPVPGQIFVIISASLSDPG